MEKHKHFKPVTVSCKFNSCFISFAKCFQNPSMSIFCKNFRNGRFCFICKFFSENFHIKQKSDIFVTKLRVYKKFQQTRKSSCVNTRGIPTTAYQVLHVLSGVSGLDLARVPPYGQTDKWTDTCQNITLSRTAYAVGKNKVGSFCVICGNLDKNLFRLSSGKYNKLPSSQTIQFCNYKRYS